MERVTSGSPRILCRSVIRVPRATYTGALFNHWQEVSPEGIADRKDGQTLPPSKLLHRFAFNLPRSAIQIRIRRGFSYRKLCYYGETRIISLSIWRSRFFHPSLLPVAALFLIVFLPPRQTAVRSFARVE